MITGIPWSYIEDSIGAAHTHLLSPNIEFMIELFGRYSNAPRSFAIRRPLMAGKGGPPWSRRARSARRNKAVNTRNLLNRARQ
jgi:hypothetical protein